MLMGQARHVARSSPSVHGIIGQYYDSRPSTAIPPVFPKSDPQTFGLPSRAAGRST